MSKPRITRKLVNAIAAVCRDGETNSCGCDQTGNNPHKHSRSCFVYMGRKEYDRVHKFIHDAQTAL